MCDVLVSKDGIELETVGDAARYGLAVPASLLSNPIHGDRKCLCGINVEELLNLHPSTWRRGAGLAGSRGWSEEDADGCTWWDGFDRYDPGDDERSGSIARSDGREARTLDNREASGAR